MARVTTFAHPFLLGFGQLEQLLDRVGRMSNDGYPPFNIEQLDADGEAEHMRITFAVAGFRKEELSVTQEANELTIRGRQSEDDGRAYLHRGIAARQFQRVFVLADGMEVNGARLENGLLSIDLIRPEPSRSVKTIPIDDATSDAGAKTAGPARQAEPRKTAV